MTNGPTIYSPTAQNPLVAKVLQEAQNGPHAHEPSSSDVSRDSRVGSYYDDSRASTPDSALEMSFRRSDVDRKWDEKAGNVTVTAVALESTETEEEALLDTAVGAAGRQPEEVYTRTLSWWRAAIRRRIVQNVEWESAVLANMQVRLTFRT